MKDTKYKNTYAYQLFLLIHILILHYVLLRLVLSPLVPLTLGVNNRTMLVLILCCFIIM